MLTFGKNLDKYSAKFLNRTQVFLMDCFVYLCIRFPKGTAPKDEH